MPVRAVHRGTRNSAGKKPAHLIALDGIRPREKIDMISEWQPEEKGESQEGKILSVAGLKRGGKMPMPTWGRQSRMLPREMRAVQQ